MMFQRKRRRILGEEDGGSGVGDGKRFVGGEIGERGAGDAERAAVIGVSGGEVVASEDGLLHQPAAILALPHGVLVVQLRSRAPHHFSQTKPKNRVFLQQNAERKWKRSTEKREQSS